MLRIISRSPQVESRIEGGEATRIPGGPMMCGPDGVGSVESHVAGAPGGPCCEDILQPFGGYWGPSSWLGTPGAG